MLLSRLLRQVNTVWDGPDADITGIAYDSRRVERGNLFVAIPSVGGGAESGGVRHVPAALERGAVAAVVETGVSVPGGQSLNLVRVPSARAALADLAAAFYGHPSREMRLFGVTGTDGKTTTTYLLEQILAAAGRRTGLIGTVELKIGERRERNLERMTTPEALELQRLLAEMRDVGVQDVAMEVSSHALALERVRSCRFAATALTNITADHVEFHGSWEAYFQAKARLFAEVGAGRPAVLNADDPHFGRFRAISTGPVLTYGLDGKADLVASRLEPEGVGTRAQVTLEGERAEVFVPLPGRFNVANALAALGLAHVAGLSLQEAAAGLSAAEPPPGRLQPVESGQPFDLYVDYAHTMHAFRSVLHTLRERRPQGRLIAVFGATGDRDRQKRPVLAQIAREYTDFFIITNEDPYSEQPGDIMAEVAAGVPADEEGTRFICEEDRGAAIRQAVRRAAPGDTVVVLGKGHEQSMVVNGAKQPWSDLQAAQQALQELE